MKRELHIEKEEDHGEDVNDVGDRELCPVPEARLGSEPHL